MIFKSFFIWWNISIPSFMLTRIFERDVKENLLDFKYKYPPFYTFELFYKNSHSYVILIDKLSPILVSVMNTDDFITKLLFRSVFGFREYVISSHVVPSLSYVFSVYSKIYFCDVLCLSSLEEKNNSINSFFLSIFGSKKSIVDFGVDRSDVVSINTTSNFGCQFSDYINDLRELFVKKQHKLLYGSFYSSSVYEVSSYDDICSLDDMNCEFTFYVIGEPCFPDYSFFGDRVEKSDYKKKALGDVMKAVQRGCVDMRKVLDRVIELIVLQNNFLFILEQWKSEVYDRLRCDSVYIGKKRMMLAFEPLFQIYQETRKNLLDLCSECIRNRLIRRFVLEKGGSRVSQTLKEVRMKFREYEYGKRDDSVELTNLSILFKDNRDSEMNNGTNRFAKNMHVKNNRQHENERHCNNADRPKLNMHNTGKEFRESEVNNDINRFSLNMHNKNKEFQDSKLNDRVGRNMRGDPLAGQNRNISCKDSFLSELNHERNSKLSHSSIYKNVAVADKGSFEDLLRNENYSCKEINVILLKIFSQLKNINFENYEIIALESEQNLRLIKEEQGTCNALQSLSLESYKTLYTDTVQKLMHYNELLHGIIRYTEPDIFKKGFHVNKKITEELHRINYKKGENEQRLLCFDVHRAILDCNGYILNNNSIFVDYLDNPKITFFLTNENLIVTNRRVIATNLNILKKGSYEYLFHCSILEVRVLKPYNRNEYILIFNDQILIKNEEIVNSSVVISKSVKSDKFLKNLVKEKSFQIRLKENVKEIYFKEDVYNYYFLTSENTNVKDTTIKDTNMKDLNEVENVQNTNSMKDVKKPEFTRNSTKIQNHTTQNHTIQNHTSQQSQHTVQRYKASDYIIHFMKDEKEYFNRINLEGFYLGIFFDEKNVKLFYKEKEEIYSLKYFQTNFFKFLKNILDFDFSTKNILKEKFVLFEKDLKNILKKNYKKKFKNLSNLKIHNFKEKCKQTEIYLKKFKKNFVTFAAKDNKKCDVCYDFKGNDCNTGKGNKVCDDSNGKGCNTGRDCNTGKGNKGCDCSNGNTNYSSNSGNINYSSNIIFTNDLYNLNNLKSIKICEETKKIVKGFYLTTIEEFNYNDLINISKQIDKINSIEFFKSYTFNDSNFIHILKHFISAVNILKDLNVYDHFKKLFINVNENKIKDCWNRIINNKDNVEK